MLFDEEKQNFSPIQFYIMVTFIGI